LVPVPPRVAPPLFDVVEEVPGGVGFVAPDDVPVALDELLEELLELDVGLVLLVVGAVLVLVGVVEDELELLEVQSLAASALTVPAP
jgi:hypothetical protein